VNFRKKASKLGLSDKTNGGSNVNTQLKKIPIAISVSCAVIRARRCDSCTAKDGVYTVSKKIVGRVKRSWGIELSPTLLYPLVRRHGRATIVVGAAVFLCCATPWTILLRRRGRGRQGISALELLHRCAPPRPSTYEKLSSAPLACHPKLTTFEADPFKLKTPPAPPPCYAPSPTITTSSPPP
jgi:hypothetical protein